MNQIMQEVQESIPSASYETCRRYLNNEIISLATKYHLKEKTVPIDSVSGQFWYPIGDLDSEMGVNKVYRVSLLNSDSKYELIRRLVGIKNVKIWDRD
jgi:hypothetical protein